MSVNGGSADNQCKRPHEDEEDAHENKKLCTDDGVPEVIKLPRRKKFAILLGYNGGNYRGMQINKEVVTIEFHLLTALLKSGLIKENEFKELHLTRFQRAARTDKGVSAAHQVVSLLMSEKFSLEEMNSYLPEDIRVFSIKRVTKNFDCKVNCDARTYSYLLPTQALSSEPMSTFLETDYRISPESIKEINDILSLYCGTHNFYNFTHKRLYGDPSCKRYIMSFTCSEPFVRGKEFILLTVKGQSFMLHQIRKMVGTVLSIRRGMSPPEIIQDAFRSEDWRIPLAPAQGLFLERPHFDKYDRRYGQDGIHETLTWDDVEDEVIKFREEKIINRIIDDELKNKTIADWIENSLGPIIKSSTCRDAKSQDADKETKTEEKNVMLA